MKTRYWLRYGRASFQFAPTPVQGARRPPRLALPIEQGSSEEIKFTQQLWRRCTIVQQRLGLFEQRRHPAHLESGHGAIRIGQKQRRPLLFDFRRQAVEPTFDHIPARGFRFGVPVSFDQVGCACQVVPSQRMMQRFVDQAVVGKPSTRLDVDLANRIFPILCASCCRRNCW